MKMLSAYMRGDQKVRRKWLPFLHHLINSSLAGITAINTAIHMQLVDKNMNHVSHLRAL